jgi:hypothetical protein
VSLVLFESCVFVIVKKTAWLPSVVLSSRNVSFSSGSLGPFNFCGASFSSMVYFFSPVHFLDCLLFHRMSFFLAHCVFEVASFFIGCIFLSPLRFLVASFLSKVFFLVPCIFWLPLFSLEVFSLAPCIF